MHKRRVNELKLRLAIEPAGPILIKSGEESGADPTLPAMNFVRTLHPDDGARTIYLPGSSLKGVVRSHVERILRTALPAGRENCCDPLDRRNHCSGVIWQRKIEDTAEQYKTLCLACRIFGHMVQASHFYPADAYPTEAIDNLPVRQNVAIDRLSGGVAVGPFDMEVALEGRFVTTFSLFNFELWQVGLLALALRDLAEGRLRLGFAKSRGLGEVRVHLLEMEVGYPGRLDGEDGRFQKEMVGAGALVSAETRKAYGYVDFDDGPDVVAYKTAGDYDEEAAAWGRPAVRFGTGESDVGQMDGAALAEADAAVRAALRPAVGAWTRFLRRRREGA